MAVNNIFGQINPIKVKERLNLIFTPGLLSHHALAGSNQTAILQLRTARDVNPFQFPAPEAPAQLAAVGSIPPSGSFFIGRRDIGRVDHDTVHPFSLKLIMCPEPAKTGFIHRLTGRYRKVAFKIMNQFVRFRRLGKSLMLALFRKNAHAPTLLVDIQSHVNRLTRKIKFANMFHGKSPFGLFFYPKKVYPKASRLAFLFQS